MLRFLRLLLSAAIILSFTAFQPANPPPAQAQPPDWVQMPSPRLPGGTILALAVSPSAPDNLYVLVENPIGINLYISPNGGETWEYRVTFSFAQGIKGISVDPTDPAIVYAGGSDGLWRLDEWLHWEKIAPVGEVFAVVTADLLYAAGRSGVGQGACQDSQYVFMKSTNGGADWTSTELGCAGELDQMAVIASQPEVVYLTGTSFHDRVDQKTVNGGDAWIPLSTQFYGATNSFIIDPEEPDRLVASSSSGLFYSTDGGQTWIAGDKNAINEYGLRLALSGSTLYALPGTVYPAHFYRSDDRGASWWQSVNELPAGGLALAAVPGRPGQLVAGLLGYGVYRSENGGGAWVETNAGIYTPARVNAIAPAPSDDQTLYVSTSTPYPALLRTLDQGAAWELLFRSSDDLPSRSAAGPQFVPTSPSRTGAAWPMPLTLSKIVVHPLDSNVAWAGGKSGLYETLNGVDWRSVESFAAVVDLEVSSIAPDQPYAIAYDRMSYQPYGFHSRFWQSIFYWYEHAIYDLQDISAMAIDPFDPRHILAGSVVYVNNIKMIGIVSSQDEGNSWEPIGTIAADGSVFDLVVSPLDPDLMMASIGYSPVNVVVCSSDGGKTWSNCSAGLPEFDKYAPRSLALDDFGSAYLGSRGVYTRTRGEDTWHPFGLSGQSIDALAVYSGERRILYAAAGHELWLRMLPGWRSWLPLVGK
jgi:photosystem II stability/assembly factor-like uncharacterized protein